ncbi:MAG: two-component sensor histidine kinase [Sphingomonadales bacterium]|jgi:signal transduction histidine kinase|uniref:ATP-binding protein n=4 Tax=Sphingorhabdus sp. TaxID=1902408 RepID=UPI003BB13A6B|nr:two-component sensor histidine kinase [Sphingomonadales bacterium]MBK9433149.1 two-component sensor histidine kinase [Sphingomonadales bacterium]MBL0021641.1 two-component sensor histidine kinase [Sphingomonadales bacterium]
MALLRKLWPSSLFGQLMLVVAVALLVAQSVNTLLLIHGTRMRAELEASSMLVARLANQIERRRLTEDSAIPVDRRSRRRLIVVISDAAPVTAKSFHIEHELTERATDYLQSVDPEIRAISLAAGPIAELPERLQRKEQRDLLENRLSKRDEAHGPDKAILLNMQLGDGSWVSAAAPVRKQGPNPVFILLAQMITLYLGVLIPLALIARRIARPLRILTRHVRATAFGLNAPNLVPEGPSDIRNLIDALNGAQERVDRMITEKDVMLGAIGHDLKTPLASLRVRIESVEDEAERQKMASTVEEMVAMLDDILMLARVGKQSDPLQKTDMVALVDAVCEDFPADAKIDLTLPDQRITADVRPILLKRAIRNIVSNALQYGGDAMVSLEQTANGVAILVDDNGPGIPEEAMKDLLEPFARAEGSRNRGTGGSGLGLTIARAISEAHGGSIKLENRPEGGLRACLLIKG